MSSNLSRRTFIKWGAGSAAALGLMGIAGCSGGTQNAASGSAKGSGTQSITDLKGDTVAVPTNIEKICEFWHAHNQILLMLGAGDKIASTTASFQKMAWAQVVYPRLKDIPALVDADNNVNIEEVLKINPSVCFASNADQIKQARENNLTAVNVMFQDYDGLRNNVALTAKILGSDAEKLADTWKQLLDENIDFVAKKMSGTSDSSKAKVLHIVSGSSFTKIDGTKCIVDEWIKLAGGVNAIQKEGNMIDVTMEDIVAADPDVIIIGSANVTGVDKLMADAAWSGITAVKNKAVYANPKGVFPWDRYSGEEALQVLWAAQKLNPSKFTDVNMVEKTQHFYSTFYGYNLSEAQANQILSCEDPK